ncbi:hypothetical protein ACFS07_24585 [Undibacterium arcticum]
MQEEGTQLMAIAESADPQNLPDGLAVPEEIACRQGRLGVLDEAKRKLDARAHERDIAAQAEYEARVTPILVRALARVGHEWNLLFMLMPSACEDLCLTGSQPS